MFIVLLRFSKNKSRAAEQMAAHDEWVNRGLDDGVFVLVGSLQPKLGGVVVAHDIARADLDRRLRTDPFVAHGVVDYELLEVVPSKADARLAFMLP